MPCTVFIFWHRKSILGEQQYQTKTGQKSALQSRLNGIMYHLLQVAWSALHVRPRCARMHLSNSVSASVSPQQIPVQQKRQRSTLYLKQGEEDQGGEREGGRGALKLELLAWHGSPFSSPCKVFTISLSVASLSRKWGQRVTWRGGKRSRSGKAFVWRMANLSPSPSQGREVFFFFLFVVKPTVISRLQWGETKKREEEKKNVRPFAGPEPFQMRARLLFLQPCQERSPN